MAADKLLAEFWMISLGVSSFMANSTNKEWNQFIFYTTLEAIHTVVFVDDEDVSVCCISAVCKKTVDKNNWR